MEGGSERARERVDLIFSLRLDMHGMDAEEAAGGTTTTSATREQKTSTAQNSAPPITNCWLDRLWRNLSRSRLLFASSLAAAARRPRPRPSPHEGNHGFSVEWAGGLGSHVDLAPHDRPAVLRP